MKTHITHTSTDAIRVGDTITMVVPVRRKWWAFWRPRYTMERRWFKITAASE
jgi:hypothetical protein